MAFTASHLGSTNPRLSLPRAPRPEEYESSSSTDSPDTARRPAHQIHFATSTSAAGPSVVSDYLFPISGRSSQSSTATSTPIPSRSVSPLPQFFTTGPSSPCSSDTESEPTSPLLGTRRQAWWREDRRRWWTIGQPRRRRRRDGRIIRLFKKYMRRAVRHPLFPRQPITIVLTLLLLTLFGVFLTLLLIHILNPDKEPLPWRAYCSVPPSSSPPHYSPTDPPPLYSIPSTSGSMPAPFPPVHLDTLPPAGVFIGVFSMDTAFERRMLVRTTWATHPRSRHGASDGDNGDGTSRTVVRFVLGQPRKHWERRIKLEMEMYNDIIILPMGENMNAGKTHSFFSWASASASVPPVYFDSSVAPPQFSYSNVTVPPPTLAPHDPAHAWKDQALGRHTSWVRPDFVVKVDDDSFVMLAELESRLRLELHQKAHHLDTQSTSVSLQEEPVVNLNATATNVFSYSNLPYHSPHASGIARTATDSLLPSSNKPDPRDDPLVYWGYLVKNRFMAGELYALSWSLADWVANDATVKTMTRGAEDKQTAKWMQLHPRAQEVRWISERCWIYDHPRAGTVYSHGFLFPSEVARVKRGIVSYFDKTPQDVLGDVTSPLSDSVGINNPIPPAWSYSSVSTFGVRYSAPIPDLTITQSVEALIEGSDMSTLREGSPMTPVYAWLHREGRKKRYEEKRVGGTVVVHFIKKNMWFLETALALLEGDEYSESEKFQRREDEARSAKTGNSQDKATSSAFSKAIARHRRR